MIFIRHKYVFRSLYSAYLVFVLLFWSLFLFLGFSFAGAMDLDFHILMHLLISQPMSIAGIVLAYFLPLIVSGLAVRRRMVYCILLICSLKGFLCGFLLCATVIAFRAYGWLVFILWFLPGLVNTTILLWLLLGVLDINSNSKRNCTLAVCGTIAVVLTEYFVLMPFSASIVNQIL